MEYDKNLSCIQTDKGNGRKSDVSLGLAVDYLTHYFGMKKRKYVIETLLSGQPLQTSFNIYELWNYSEED